MTTNDQVKVLLAALQEARRAIGDHYAPNDCYATGPMTGNAMRDLVQCPACSAIAMYDEAIKSTERAATQPAGEVVAWLYEWPKGSVIFKGVKPLDPESEEYFDFVPTGSTATALVRLAAPISEDTATGPVIFDAKSGGGTAAARKAVERIDAMHKGVVGVFAALKEDHERDIAKEAARTPASVGSIALDERFADLLKMRDLAASDCDPDMAHDALEKLVAHIDNWASSRATQPAAPERSGKAADEGSEIRWVDMGTKQVFGRPTATDALEYANERLTKTEEVEGCKTDIRLPKMDKVRELLAPAGNSSAAPSDLRQQFESWAKSEGHKNFMRMAGDSDTYDDYILRHQYKSYLAALAAPAPTGESVGVLTDAPRHELRPADNLKITLECGGAVHKVVLSRSAMQMAVDPKKMMHMHVDSMFNAIERHLAATPAKTEG